MENLKSTHLNTLLGMVVLLMFFYIVMMTYFKYGFKQTSTFTPVDSGIPDVEKPPALVPILSEPNIYETEDTRIQYPLLPPVNPMVRNAVRQNVIPANPDLYSSQTYTSGDYILDTPPTDNTNQLLYSGGETQMIKVPLQYNYPYNEAVRSLNVLVTPYNKIKYGDC
jgi:hypothetical protein